MHRNEATQNRQEPRVPISLFYFPTSLQDVPKTVKYCPKISQKSHFEIRHYAMPPPGGALENFCTGAQLFSLRCATTSNVILNV